MDYEKEGGLSEAKQVKKNLSAEDFVSLAVSVGPHLKDIGSLLRVLNKVWFSYRFSCFYNISSINEK